MSSGSLRNGRIDEATAFGFYTARVVACLQDANPIIQKDRENRAVPPPLPVAHQYIGVQRFSVHHVSGDLRQSNGLFDLLRHGALVYSQIARDADRPVHP